MIRPVPVLTLSALLAVVCPVIAVCQTPDAAKAQIPDLPKSSAETFVVAAPFYDFSSPALKPWHMKVSYQLYDDNGKPADQGTYEYWWASPEAYCSSWKRPGMEQTDWHLAGRHYHTGDGPSLAFYERKLQSQLLNPLPKAEDLDPDKIRFDRQEVSLGGVKLPCVMVIRKMPLNGQIQTVPMGMFPTYCFDKDKPLLRAVSSFGSTSVLYNKVARVQGMFLAQDISVYEGKRKVLTANVDKVDGLSAQAEALRPPADVISVNDGHAVQIGSGVAQGYLLKQVRPIYPEEAKQARIQGKVVLQALIGVDGRIHDLSVVEGPAPSLVAAAMQCVSQWQYKPYLLAGVPVEVDTTINVIFKMGS